jgi:large subunit ribosomal protein L22
MGRSIKKGPFVDQKLASRIEGMNKKNEKRVVRTWARRSTIIPEFVGHTLAVHNGNKFIPIYVTENMVGQVGRRDGSGRPPGEEEMESRAIARYVRVTPRKVNQVLDLVRGTNVEEALTTLSFSKKHVAKTVEKTMRSAVANAIQADSKVDVDDLYVKEALVGPGPIMKRWLPRAQGRATPILKRTSHITIILADKESRKGRSGRRRS